MPKYFDDEDPEISGKLGFHLLLKKAYSYVLVTTTYRVSSKANALLITYPDVEICVFIQETGRR